MVHSSTHTSWVPRTSIGIAAISVFVANAALLILQLVAPRLLAPLVGSSLETWTSIIGVFLTGIALGNWLGGYLADRRASLKTLSILLTLGAASALLMVGLVMAIQTSAIHTAFSLTSRIPLLALLLCLPPSFLFSLSTPVAIKLALPNVGRAGRIAGLIFALSTLGCLLGNYVTGFILIPAMNLNTIVYAVAATLLGLASLIASLAFLTQPSWTSRPPVDPEATAPEWLTHPSDNDEAPPRGWLRLQDHLGLAGLLVFLASFCGMTLELAGLRKLAMQLGVSIYTWTGIIGVMLAGTAVGNYLGGIIADRGFAPGARRFGLVLVSLLAVIFARELGLYLCGIGELLAIRYDLDFFRLQWFTDFHRQLSQLVGIDLGTWLIRGLGFLVGALAFFLGLWLAETTGGLFFVGGLVGGMLAVPLGRILAEALPLDWFTQFHQWLAANSPLGDAIRLWTIRGIGVLAGLFIIGLVQLGRRLWDEDRLSASSLLGGSFILASLTTLCVFPNLGLLSRSVGIFLLDLPEKVLVWSFVLFFLPMLLLGTISPQVIRLAVRDVAHAGRTAGSIYAVSTLGAIAGTFMTGYWLISSFGTTYVLLGVAGLLFLLGVFAGQFWRNRLTLFGGGILGGCVAAGLILFSYLENDLVLETNYYAIRLQDDQNNEFGLLAGGAFADLSRYSDDDTWQPFRARALILDHLIHSSVKPYDPGFLHYLHEWIQVEFVYRALTWSPAPKVLVIGGGGYTFPRYVDVTFGDQVRLEVVEIDPGVSRVAYEKLGLRDHPRIMNYNMDGRQFVFEKARPRDYDLVVQDAVNDLSVPYHLMTKEYNDGIRRILKQEGVYLLTLIDSLKDGQLWRAAIHTMRESFPHVYLLANEKIDEVPSSRDVYVLYGSVRPLDPEQLASLLEQRGVPQRWTHSLDPEVLEQLLDQQPRLVLTDQHAPVDNLMQPQFRASFR